VLLTRINAIACTWWRQPYRHPNTQMRVFHALLSHPGTRYEDLGASWYDSERQAARRVSRHVGALGAMGYEVTLCRKPQPGEPAPAA
jgi:hypothetical protein